jgi:hypothetical protein
MTAESLERRLIHLRSYEFRGYSRSDGLWDIEGALRDTKTDALPNAWRGTIPAGEAIHDMWIRLTVDVDLVVRDIAAVTKRSPYEICPEATAGMSSVKGLAIGPGWRRNLNERLGGARGCTHHLEMLYAIGTVAIQTLYSVRRERPNAQVSKPLRLQSCYALEKIRDSDSPR